MNEARPSRRLVIVAITVGSLSLIPAALAMFMARLMTYGFHSWVEPQLDANIWLPLLGFSLSLCLGPAIMTLGQHRRRWLRATLGVFVAAARRDIDRTTQSSPAPGGPGPGSYGVAGSVRDQAFA